MHTANREEKADGMDTIGGGKSTIIYMPSQNQVFGSSSRKVNNLASDIVNMTQKLG